METINLGINGGANETKTPMDFIQDFANWISTMPIIDQPEILRELTKMVSNQLMDQVRMHEEQLKMRYAAVEKIPK